MPMDKKDGTWVRRWSITNATVYMLTKHEQRESPTR